MKRNQVINMRRFFTIALSLSILGTYLYPHSAAAAPSPEPASESAEIDSEAIKENIKRRIQEVMKSRSSETRKRVAYTGTISSITTNSLSLETDQGVRQASTSATQTVAIELPASKEIKTDEVSIGDYVSALGFLPDSGKVLDARRLLVLKAPPEKPSTGIMYGRITKIDKKNGITLENSKLAQTKQFTLTTKSDLYIADTKNHTQELTLKDLEPESTVVIVYDPDSNKVLQLTVKAQNELTLKPTPTPKPTPKP